MVRFRQKIVNLLVKIYTKFFNNALRQGENIAKEGRSAATPGMDTLLRRAAAEGAVLLKNDGTLPLEGKKTAFFGRTQTDSFYTGYGSGGDVVKPYRVSILDGVEENGAIDFDRPLAQEYRAWAQAHPVDHGYWGNWPRYYPEMPLTERLVAEAAARAGTAVVVIGRAAGEDRENETQKGSYYLTDDENKMLDLVTSAFRRTAVVLNIGSVIDLSWTEKYKNKISALLIVWQGGMETGNAVADLLSGAVSPSGKLTDTIARRYEDYPSAAHFGNADYNEYAEDIFVGYRWFETFAKDRVLYPFGFGLSYTQFEVFAREPVMTDDGMRVRVCVKNIGQRAGKETVQVYLEKPCGVLGNAARELAAFAKTSLLAPDEEESLELLVPYSAFYSYDEEGRTGFCSCYVVEKGKYSVYAGTDVRSAERIGGFESEHTVCMKQCEEQSAPVRPFLRTEAAEEDGVRRAVVRPVPLAKADLAARMTASIPHDRAFTGDRGILLSDVKEGRATMEDFVAQLSVEELEAVSRGDYTMNSPLGPEGNAGVFAGVLPSLRKKGIPPVVTTDGPSGIRLCRASSLVPIGTALACSFDCALAEEVYEAVGREMLARGTDVLLAPALNLHRNPLCGRNFEYFSEDPLLSGKIAAAAVRGVQKTGAAACPKHFACNNQEFNRNRNDSRLSERALRELYLRAFEICVREGKPLFLMTSYNKINGVWGHYHYALCEGILRKEWGFGGCVMTDWWMRSARCPEFPSLRDNAYRVRARVNLLMPGGGYLGRRKPDGTLLKTYGKKKGITLGELQRNAAEILGAILTLPAMDREYPDAPAGDNASQNEEEEQ